MTFEHLLDSVKRHEGFRSTVYRDSEGKWTIGYGLCVDPDVEGAGITQQEAETILRMRLMRVQEEVAKSVAGFYDHPDAIQRALVEMAYQMGVNGLMRFKKMLMAISVRNYETAAVEALDSLWARQTPNRAQEIAELIKSV